MERYTQAIVVDKSLNFTLLIKRNNKPGKGLLSGVGGHIEQRETPKQCMIREYQEEVGAPIPKTGKMFPLMTEITDCENHIFAVILPGADLNYAHQDDTDNEGLIQWYPIDGVLMDIENNQLAWNGLIPYCINLIKEKLLSGGDSHAIKTG